MQPPRVPPQIVRLILLTVGIVAVYLIARSLLTPASFGDYGWFRANAIWEIASREPVYAGSKACNDCHEEQGQKLAKGSHKGLSCEGCHGAGQAHFDKPDVNRMTVLTFSHCVRCHEANPSRPKTHKQINTRTHYTTGEKCIECHVPHQPNEVP